MDHNRLPRAHTDGGERVEDILLKHDLPIHCRSPLSPRISCICVMRQNGTRAMRRIDNAKDTFLNVAEESF